MKEKQSSGHKPYAFPPIKPAARSDQLRALVLFVPVQRYADAFHEAEEDFGHDFISLFDVIEITSLDVTRIASAIRAVAMNRWVDTADPAYEL